MKKGFTLFALVILSLMAIAASGLFYEFKKSQEPNIDAHQPDNINWISTKQGNIYVKIFRNKALNDSIRLVFVIHGDAPFNKPGYQYVLTERIAAENENTIAVAILRPGYTDPDNNTSNGIRGLATGDNYTPEVIEAISEVVEKIKKLHHPSKTIVVGHSGGAAITGNIIGLKPRLADVAVLVSCPCDVAKWRKHMSKRQPFNPWWYLNVKSISPGDVAKNISKETEVIMISGANDEEAPIHLSAEYHKLLKDREIESDFISLPNEGHEILLSDPVINRIKNSLK